MPKFSTTVKMKLIYLVENIKSTNLIGYKNKIHELVIFNQTTKIDAHEEKYFHSNSFQKFTLVLLKI